ncbi:GatB/YqeY domain-containing protein [soil metagenome]
MALTQHILAELKDAMLTRQSEKTGVLRMLQAELKNTQIKLGHELSDDEALLVIRKEVKKRNESAALYTTHGQADRAAAETAEATLLTTYLPAQVSDEVLTAFLKEEISAAGGTFLPTMQGTLIKAALAKFGSQVDGRQVSNALATLKQG